MLFLPNTLWFEIESYLSIDDFQRFTVTPIGVPLNKNHDFFQFYRRYKSVNSDYLQTIYFADNDVVEFLRKVAKLDCLTFPRQKMFEPISVTTAIAIIDHDYEDCPKPLEFIARIHLSFDLEDLDHIPDLWTELNENLMSCTESERKMLEERKSLNVIYDDDSQDLIKQIRSTTLQYCDIDVYMWNVIFDERTKKLFRERTVKVPLIDGRYLYMYVVY